VFPFLDGLLTNLTPKTCQNLAQWRENTLGMIEVIDSWDYPSGGYHEKMGELPNYVYVQLTYFFDSWKKCSTDCC
jgi:hypothetical protein